MLLTKGETQFAMGCGRQHLTGVCTLLRKWTTGHHEGLKQNYTGKRRRQKSFQDVVDKLWQVVEQHDTREKVQIKENHTILENVGVRKASRMWSTDCGKLWSNMTREKKYK